MRAGRSNLRILRNDMNGRSLQIGQDPTATVDRPWNNVVVSLTAITNGNLTVGTLSNAFNSQVGAGTNTPSMEFRVRELRAWETTGSNIAATILDLVSSNDHRTQHDEPGRNHWASVGLQWSNPQQQLTITSSDVNKILAKINSSNATIAAVLHVHIQWRFGGSPVPTLNDIVVV